MKTVFSRLAIATAAVSMAFSPIAAQANTRASDTGRIYVAQTGTTSDPWIIRDDEAGGFWLDSRGILVVVLGAIAITGLIAAASGGGGNNGGGNQSPGAN